MSDFIEVGTISKKTLIRTITFSCAGKIDRRKLDQFQKVLLALLAEYGLKCVSAKGGSGTYGTPGSTGSATAKRPSARKKTSARKTGKP